jgi:hypothetical protein
MLGKYEQLQKKKKDSFERIFLVTFKSLFKKKLFKAKTLI